MIPLRSKGEYIKLYYDANGNLYYISYANVKYIDGERDEKESLKKEFDPVTHF